MFKISHVSSALVVFLAPVLYAIPSNAQSTKVSLSMESAELPSYESLKQVITAQCIGCHGPSSRSGLNLTVFPFVSATGQDLNTIVTKIIARARDTDKPMPPKPRPAMAESDIVSFESWLAAGLPEKDLKRYVTKVSLFDVEGALLKEDSFRSMTNPHTDQASYEVKVVSEL